MACEMKTSNACATAFINLFHALPKVLGQYIRGFIEDCIGFDSAGNCRFIYYHDLEEISKMDRIYTITPLVITADNKYAFSRQVWGSVRLIGDMSHMFDKSIFNGHIAHWDVSQVEDMSYMFFKSHFNRDISGWDVSHADTHLMFSGSRYSHPVPEDCGPDVLECKICNEDEMIERKVDEDYFVPMGLYCSYHGHHESWIANQFEDDYLGQWDNPIEFCKSIVPDTYNDLPDWLKNATDWDRVWTNIRHEFIYVDGYMFNDL